MDPNQYEEQLIDDPEPVNDKQLVENEIELSHCIVQTEEVMQMSVKDEGTLETNSSEHQCGICGKELLSAYTLANHMRSHTGERPYGCSVCEKFFKTKSNLNEHYRLVVLLFYIICNHKLAHVVVRVDYSENICLFVLTKLCYIGNRYQV